MNLNNFLLFKIPFWKLIVILIITIIIHDLIIVINNRRTFATKEERKKYYQTTLNILGVTVKRGDKVRLYHEGREFIGKIIGMNDEDYVMVASSNQALFVGVELIEQIELIK